MRRNSRRAWRWARRLGLVLTVASGGQRAQSGIAVAGMSQYTDHGFGVSFWYPAAWKVTEEAAGADLSAWFQGARIVKELRIDNPLATEDNNQPPGVTVTELAAPAAGLTELGQTRSASPVGMDVQYYFDGKRGRWMEKRLSESPDGRAPGTEPLEIRDRTAEGLPIIYGAARHSAEVIVLLSPTHFVAVKTMDVGGNNNHLYLAKTVIVSRSSGRTGADKQAESIRVEAEKLDVNQR